MGRSPSSEKNELKKGPWTPEEDQKLIDYIQKNGYGNWRILPNNAGLQRCGKSCRLRWTNYLRPDIKRGRFSFEEEQTIIQLHSVLGNKWSVIAGRLPGRTDNEIKNYWNTHIRKRLLRMGIDPVTHGPRLDLLHLSTILSNHSPYTNMNFSKLIEMQNLIKPELVRLASSLFSSSSHTQSLIQPCQIRTNQVQDSTVPLIPNDCFDSLPDCVSVPGHVQAHRKLMQYDVVGQNAENCSGFGSSEGHVHVTEYGSSETMLSSDNAPTFRSNTCSNNFIFQSVLSDKSTPSYSLTPLESSSTYINGSSCTTEDEMESYCSNILKFDIPDILDNLY